MNLKKCLWPVLVTIIIMCFITWFASVFYTSDHKWIKEYTKPTAADYRNVYLQFNKNFKLKTLIPPSPSLTGPPVYFIITTDTKPLNLRAACAIESASMHHKDSQIIILPVSAIKDNLVTQTLLVQPNVKFLNITFPEILEDTPLEKWYAKGIYKSGKYAVTHLSDAIRIALLWKYGGIYLDTDVWCLKSLSKLRNSIGLQSVEQVNGAVMHFDKFHHFLYDAIVEFVLHYDKNYFDLVGPALFTNVLKLKCNVKGNLKSVPLKEYTNCYDVNVLPISAFYPIYYTEAKEYFKSRNEAFKDTYAIHLWNQLTRYTTAKVGSGVLVDEAAKFECPNIYKLMEVKEYI